MTAPDTEGLLAVLIREADPGLADEPLAAARRIHAHATRCAEGLALLPDSADAKRLRRAWRDVARDAGRLVRVWTDLQAGMNRARDAAQVVQGGAD